MSSVDYSIFSREKIQLSDLSSETYDFFISSFNSSERVRSVFDFVSANSKVWVVHPEYGYATSELPDNGSLFFGRPDISPIEFWEELFEWMKLPKGSARIAIDITGMMRPHLMLLPLMLRHHGFSDATMFYSDPTSYASGEKTKFSKGPVEGVSLVTGMEGVHESSTDSKDVLLIGAGYDHTLVQAVAEHKRSSEHFILLGLPSLQPHMYQESVLRVSDARESIRDYRNRTFLFAPANDPFMTAQVLSDHFAQLRKERRVDNVYLCPVGAKTQVLGFSWFFLCEARNDATSMLFPVNKHYERETSRGISAVHRFEMELDMIVELQ